MSKQKDKLIKPKEVAKMLCVSTKTLYNYEKKGVLKPFILPSGHRRYWEKEVEELLKK